METEKKKYFITMHSKPLTTQFDWQRQIEELRAIVGSQIPAEDWATIWVYGPGDGGWGIPAICFEVSLNKDSVNRIVGDVSVSSWIDLSVAIWSAEAVTPA